MLISRLFVSLIALLFSASASVAQQPATQPINTPIYDPAAKRYFALMPTEKRAFAGSWDNVATQARRQVFKGVQGRLAIVDNFEIHEFLLRHFHPDHYQYVWIGLRYLCRARRLEWSDGRAFTPGSFQVWDVNWKQDIYVCSDKNDPRDWAPVAYSPEMRSWIVKGRHKQYEWSFIEFPTGQP
jgi:hypothetical protein